MKEIILASSNKGKLAELTDLLADLGIGVLSAYEAGFTGEIEETGDSFEENALIKAEAVSLALNCMALADDSGLAVDALGGSPGVRSARYAGEDADDAANNAKLLQAMAGIPRECRGAQFISVIALAIPGESSKCFVGICEGEVLNEPRGQLGFGYDPLFLPAGMQKSYAEMAHDEKNALSHRGKAMRLLKDYLVNNII